MRRGPPYARPGGHGYFEIALDSFLHEQDTGNRAVPVKPTPQAGGRCPGGGRGRFAAGHPGSAGRGGEPQALADAFWHTRRMRRMFVSRLKIKYAFFWLVEPLFGGRGFITAHMTPARFFTVPRRGRTASCPTAGSTPLRVNGWRRDGIDGLLEKATRRSAAYMMAAQGYWAGKLRAAKVMGLLGSASYLSGIPDEERARASWTACRRK